MDLMKSHRNQRGFSLIAMLVIVILVGGVAAAFFLLSQTEEVNSEVARNRTKAYYLGEAALDQVGSMLKTAAAHFIMPPNPAGGTSPISGTMTVQGMTSTWWFQHLSATNTWVPAWQWNTSLSGGNYVDPVSGTVITGPQQADATNAAGATSLQLYVIGTYTILLEPATGIPAIDKANSETFTYTCTNYQNLTPQQIGNTTVKNYFTINISGRVRHYDGSGLRSAAAKGTNVSLTREIELNNQSLLPFFAFYNNDLEFLPGPPFVGNGLVHTNRDLYLGAGSSIDLNTNYIGAVGQMYRHRKNDGSYTENAGPVTIHQPIAGTPAPGQIGAGSASWAESLESASVSGSTVTPNSGWAAGLTSAGLSPTVQAGAPAMSTPPVGSIQPPPAAGQPGGTYYNWATNPGASGGGVATGLVITIDTTGTPTAMYNGGSGQTDVTSTLVSQGVITPGQIADNRQSQTSYLPTTNIDMGKLRTSGFMPRGGILYVTDARNGAPTLDANGNLQPPATPPTLPAGVVFSNGKNLDAPVSLVSNGPVYVQGDFNAPDSTTLNAATGAPFQKQMSMVMADAVNLLSNAWNGSKTPGGGAPVASDTSYNFALITGNVPTDASAGRYSGGLENLPRFQENWGGIKCNYRGSLINLWTSSIATGAWGQNNVYSPPNRNWDWDSSFGTATAQIPGFPKAVTISRTLYMMDYWGAGGSSGYRSP